MASDHRAVIDGFIVSPNVEVLSLSGVDLGFEASDHQPVRVRLAARDC